MSDLKTQEIEIFCDACGATYLAERYHLGPDLDLCYDCGQNIHNGTLSRSQLLHFARAILSFMKWTSQDIDDTPQDIDDNTPVDDTPVKKDN